MALTVFITLALLALIPVLGGLATLQLGRGPVRHPLERLHGVEHWWGPAEDPCLGTRRAASAARASFERTVSAYLREASRFEKMGGNPEDPVVSAGGSSATVDGDLLVRQAARIDQLRIARDRARERVLSTQRLLQQCEGAALREPTPVVGPRWYGYGLSASVMLGPVGWTTAWTRLIEHSDPERWVTVRHRQFVYGFGFGAERVSQAFFLDGVGGLDDVIGLRSQRLRRPRTVVGLGVDLMASAGLASRRPRARKAIDQLRSAANAQIPVPDIPLGDLREIDLALAGEEIASTRPAIAEYSLGPSALLMISWGREPFTEVIGRSAVMGRILL
ncbi:MAG: hypothetical protein GY713_07500 [Actinomycetia bacterium]|nr:hypothetical protein [Actinomycetes bacterium]